MILWHCNIFASSSPTCSYGLRQWLYLSVTINAPDSPLQTDSGVLDTDFKILYLKSKTTALMG